MEKTVYTLWEDCLFSDAAKSALMPEEQIIWCASLAGLRYAGRKESQQTGIFLRADAQIDPDELAKVAAAAKKSMLLCDDRGDELGYILTEGDPPGDEGYSALPRTLLRNSRRFSVQNYREILAEQRKKVLAKLSEAGVFFESDEVSISPLYTIGAGTFIARGTTLSGSGVIGQNCALLGGRYHNVTLGDGVRAEQSVLLEARVGDNTTVGPFAYLRPGTVVGCNARIGDFVELKNTVIGDGTKVSHLTYVGDSDVGSGVNFGCGTVTSNYDGEKKYRTVIGDNVFVGCNTNLIAPVTVESDSYIAAGSTITDTVPAGALAIARSRQTNKEHWVAKKKPALLAKRKGGKK